MNTARKEKRQELRVKVDSQSMAIAVAVVKVLAIIEPLGPYAERKLVNIIKEHFLE